MGSWRHQRLWLISLQKAWKQIQSQNIEIEKKSVKLEKYGSKIWTWNLRVVGGAGACGGQWSGPSFGLSSSDDSSSSGQFCSVGSVTASWWETEESRSGSGNFGPFLGPFFELWFRDLFGGGSVLKTIEHVSGGRWEGISGRTTCEKPFLVAVNPRELVGPWWNTAGLFEWNLKKNSSLFSKYGFWDGVTLFWWNEELLFHRGELFNCKV